MAATVTTETRATPASVSSWRHFPTVYEISTWVWLSELGDRQKSKIDLSNVPSAEWDSIAALGFDAVWFMGVWERSPAGTAIANQNESLLTSFQQALPDFRPQDNVGSPYCVRSYIVDQNLGGPKGLASARQELANRGMKLILDFVPNHVAPDHPWSTEHPEYFIHGNIDDFKADCASYIRATTNVFACGRDPFFPAWPDVLQLNAFNPALRLAVRETVAGIATQCDGIRCDMAMLMLNSVFERTWIARAGSIPSTEYWADLISTTKQQHPGFLFMAEAYWDLEWQLQQLGFDFCYDKKLYDRLEHGNAESVRQHLCAEPAYQEKLVRFIENHDEPRAATAFPAAKQRAAALATLTLPGMRLLYEGQLQGRRVRLPVFLDRRPEEASDSDLHTFYQKLLKTLARPAFHDGQWKLCERNGWPDNSTFLNLVAWTWHSDENYLIIVNLSEQNSQARVQLSWPELNQGSWRLTDTLSGVSYDRDSKELSSSGLYVELAPFAYNLFRCEPIINPIDP